METIANSNTDPSVNDFDNSSRQQKYVQRYENRDLTSGRSLPPAPGYERQVYTKSINNFNYRDTKRDNSFDINQSRSVNESDALNVRKDTSMSGLDMRSEGHNDKHTFYSKFLKAKQ